ncbi:hypothetical protein H8R23_05030 [Flavobacterium sp. F-380]|uniref:Uncharacterized protein n=1 Tax=Flavobacterium kayseriense TaxID=2764714 RepID=A0ABR7J5E7_9FLAO|nr:hypothetical protein [Flavobacterium kayseriense]MBC5840761.1 hypothetical protein [Flavobacterium kayseriense]MBC5846569.1 hypothetical protein [Flavobacterium kayseriense]
MKKFLIIGCGLMFSCLSAMTLPDNVPVVSYEKMTIQEPLSLFSDVVLLVDNDVVSNFIVEPKNPVQLQTFKDVAVPNVRESKGFYKPIDYESLHKMNPLSHYDIYNGRELFKNEFSVENIPRKEVF